MRTLQSVIDLINQKGYYCSDDGVVSIGNESCDILPVIDGMLEPQFENSFSLDDIVDECIRSSEMLYFLKN